MMKAMNDGRKENENTCDVSTVAIHIENENYRTVLFHCILVK